MHTDVLIIGSGISGLSLALKLSQFCDVTIITKKARMDTATNLAQGGIAAVLSKNDSFEMHIKDTLKSGDGLCDNDIVKLVVENGPDRVAELIKIGVHLNLEKNGKNFDLGMEGGHSARRVAHAMDLTGKEIETALLTRVGEQKNIKVLENHLAIDLLLSSKTDGIDGNERCIGAYVLNRLTGVVETRQAKITVLCTGGCGKVYLYTTNPDIATGDGIAMAYHAGAKVANMEFVQFHPTCFFNRNTKNFLISEAVRGEGGTLINQKGESFVKKYDPRGDLATRDAVARAIDAEMKKDGAECVYLDITHRSKEFIQERFPTIYQTCKDCGVDITSEPIPVVPAAHYMCGGVLTDQWGRATINNLFALGETACTGLHGANRLASNSLLEAVVFANQTYLWIDDNWSRLQKNPFLPVQDWTTRKATSIEENILITHNWDQIRRLMWNYVGIVRSTKRLSLVQKRLSPIFEEIRDHFFDYLLTPDLVELRNIAIVADLIVTCAAKRKESRGLHYIKDFPQRNDIHFQKNTVVGIHDE